MFTLIPVETDSITSPRANMPANRMPIAVSSLTPERLLMYPIKSATAIPVGTAAMMPIPRRKPTTMPGRTAWASASPMNESPRVIT